MEIQIIPAGVWEDVISDDCMKIFEIYFPPAREIREICKIIVIWTTLVMGGWRDIINRNHHHQQ